MAKKSRKKHLYWHDIAKNLLEMGLKAGEVAKCLKSIFPSAEITGRHVGGYRRRLINDDMLEASPEVEGTLEDGYLKMMNLYIIVLLVQLRDN